MEVRLTVAQCIVQVMRITATYDPYNREVMEGAFQLIVESFQRLCNIHNPSFGKAVNILETIAKLRACVILLDLSCEDLIHDMFHQFLIAIKKGHKKMFYPLCNPLCP